MNNSYVNFLSTALDAYSMRDSIIKENIANVDTPNYKRKYLKFEEYLNKKNDERYLKGAITNSRHIDIPQKSDSIMFRATDNTVSTREDKNNVNMDLEQVDSVKNYIDYSMVADELSNYYKQILSGITGGRK